MRNALNVRRCAFIFRSNPLSCRKLPFNDGISLDFSHNGRRNETDLQNSVLENRTSALRRVATKHPAVAPLSFFEIDEETNSTKPVLSISSTEILYNLSSLPPTLLIDCFRNFDKQLKQQEITNSENKEHHLNRECAHVSAEGKYIVLKSILDRVPHGLNDGDTKIFISLFVDFMDTILNGNLQWDEKLKNCTELKNLTNYANSSSLEYVNFLHSLISDSASFFGSYKTPKPRIPEDEVESTEYLISVLFSHPCFVITHSVNNLCATSVIHSDTNFLDALHIVENCIKYNLIEDCRKDLFSVWSNFDKDSNFVVLHHFFSFCNLLPLVEYLNQCWRKYWISLNSSTETPSDADTLLPATWHQRGDTDFFSGNKCVERNEEQRDYWSEAQNGFSEEAVDDLIRSLSASGERTGNNNDWGHLNDIKLGSFKLDQLSPDGKRHFILQNSRNLLIFTVYMLPFIEQSSCEDVLRALNETVVHYSRFAPFDQFHATIFKLVDIVNIPEPFISQISKKREKSVDKSTDNILLENSFRNDDTISLLDQCVDIILNCLQLGIVKAHSLADASNMAENVLARLSVSNCRFPSAFNLLTLPNILNLLLKKEFTSHDVHFWVTVLTSTKLLLTSELECSSVSGTLVTSDKINVWIELMNNETANGGLLWQASDVAALKKFHTSSLLFMLFLRERLCAKEAIDIGVLFIASNIHFFICKKNCRDAVENGLVRDFIKCYFDKVFLSKEDQFDFLSKLLLHIQSQEHRTAIWKELFFCEIPSSVYGFERSDDHQALFVDGALTAVSPSSPGNDLTYENERVINSVTLKEGGLTTLDQLFDFFCSKKTYGDAAKLLSDIAPLFCFGEKCGSDLVSLHGSKFYNQQSEVAKLIFNRFWERIMRHLFPSDVNLCPPKNSKGTCTVFSISNPSRKDMEDWLMFLRYLPPGCATDVELAVCLFQSMSFYSANIARQGADDGRERETSTSNQAKSISNFREPCMINKEMVVKTASALTRHFHFLDIDAVTPPMLLNWLVTTGFFTFEEAIQFLLQQIRNDDPRDHKEEAEKSHCKNRSFLYLVLPIDKVSSFSQVMRMLSSLRSLEDRGRRLKFSPTNIGTNRQELLYMSIRCFALHMWYVRALSSIFAFLSNNLSLVGFLPCTGEKDETVIVNNPNKISIELLSHFVLQETHIRSPFVTRTQIHESSSDMAFFSRLEALQEYMKETFRCESKPFDVECPTPPLIGSKKEREIDFPLTERIHMDVKEIKDLFKRNEDEISLLDEHFSQELLHEGLVQDYVNLIQSKVDETRRTDPEFRLPAMTLRIVKSLQRKIYGSYNRRDRLAPANTVADSRFTLNKEDFDELQSCINALLR